jgi:hypothetical protein
MSSATHTRPLDPVPCCERHATVPIMQAVQPNGRAVGHWSLRRVLHLSVRPRSVSLRTRIVWAVDDYREGRYWGFPLCCVLRYTFSHGEQARKRGIAEPHGNAYVPCGILHQGFPFDEC